MNALQRFEHRLEQLISGVFARAFRSAVQPVEIAAALQRECDNNAQILSRERRMVPNDFHVELAQTDLERLAPYDSTMARDFTEQLEDHAQQQGYQFPGPIRIESTSPIVAPSERMFWLVLQPEKNTSGPAPSRRVLNPRRSASMFVTLRSWKGLLLPRSSSR